MLHKAMADKGRWRAPCIIPTFYLFSDGLGFSPSAIGTFLGTSAIPLLCLQLFFFPNIVRRLGIKKVKSLFEFYVVGVRTTKL